MKLLLLITNALLLSTIVSCTFMKNKLNTNIEYLTNNFFENLKALPRLNETNLSKSSESFIDKQVQNYVGLMRKAHGLVEHSKTRRSLPTDDIRTLTRDDEGVFILTGFQGLYNIKAQFPIDIVVFSHYVGPDRDMTFAAAIERIGRNSYELVVYSLGALRFAELFRFDIKNSRKLAVYTTPPPNVHYIVVIESTDKKKQPGEKSFVFMFDGAEKIINVQNLPPSYPSDVIIWQKPNAAYMAIPYFMERQEDGKFIYEVNTPIYKWMGRHFDVIDNIKTYGAKKVAAFSIGNNHFVAVANYRNNRGDTNIYSEVFKFNLDTEKFTSYQKILTHAAVDVKYFHMGKDKTRWEHFLIFANMFQTDITDRNERIRNYDTESIVYKYVDSYFIPFQSFKLSAPTEWLPFHGTRGEFALLVVSKFDGVISYQYDGWRFVKTQVSYTNEAFSRGIVSIRAMSLRRSTAIVVANREDYYGEMMNVLEPTFFHKNMLGQFQRNMLTWCKDSTESLQFVDFESMTKKVQEAPKYDDSILQLAQVMAFSDVTIENLHTVELNATDRESAELSNMEDELNAYSKELDSLEENVKMSMSSVDSNVFDGDVYVKKLLLYSGVVSLQELTTQAINAVNVSSLVNNVININEGFQILENPITFENLTIKNKLVPTNINGQPMNARRQYIEQGLVDVIMEDGYFNHDFFIKGTLNGINFTRENILLKTGDQTFDSLEVGELTAETMRAEFINNNDRESKRAAEVVIESINTLNANTVLLGGYINNVDVPTLEKYSLKTFGEQILTNEYSFDSLHVDNINVKQLSGKKIPEDFILITEGNYRVDQDVQFIGDLNAKTININRGLNHIPVVNGELDVLLVDAAHPQHITGYKEFENVELLNPINLQGQIKSSRMGRMNPVTIIDNELVLTGDYKISGDVRIEQLLLAKDMLSSNSLSVQHLQEKGIKITENIIPVHLNFKQQLNVLEVYTDKINDIDMDSLILLNTDQPQIITGWKTFLGDVQITGPTKIENVNGINIQDLDANTMKIYGNQTLTGKYHFENVIANRVYNVETQFGGNRWEHIITAYGDQNISGTTLIANNVEVNRLETNILNCKTFNDINFTNMVDDTVLHGQNKIIGGRKEFVDLRVVNLNVPNLNLHELPKQIKDQNETFQFDENIELPDNIVIENISFSGQFNDIPSESLGQRWVFSEKEQFVNSDQHFNKITAFNEIFVLSGYINGIRIQDINENSVKTDEYFEFPSATFQYGLASLKRIYLDGQFESLNLNDIVQNHLSKEQIIAGPITFNSDVNVLGEISYNGLVSGLNITRFCNFAFPAENEPPKNLHVNGNVYFAIGPEVYLINNLKVTDIVDNAWFMDRPTVITGNMEFLQALFQEDLTVHGFIDEIKVELIAQTYLSKTRNQNVSAFLDFDENVVFANGVSAKRVSVGDYINGINLEEFMSTAFLQDYQQTFESVVYLDECQILKLQGDYKVNNLELQTDVVRYSGENIVTGNKVAYNVRTMNIILPKKRDLMNQVRIQGVALLDWLQTAILKNGVFKISGSVAFQNRTTFVNGISSLDGSVNERPFDNESIMLKSVPQEITGTKTFAPEIATQPKPYPGNISYPIQFKTMILKGNLNGIDMSDLMNKQASKSGGTVFNSPVNFNNDITIANVKMENLYQGMNITEVVGNVTSFDVANEYYNSYQNLLNISSDVEVSLGDQAYYLDYYIIKDIYQNVDIVVPVEFERIEDQYLASITRDLHNYTIKFLIWDKEGQYFRDDDGIKPIKSNRYLKFVKPITFKNQALWYMEHKNEFSNFDPRAARTGAMAYESSIYKVIEDGSLKRLYRPIVHSGSKSVVSLTIPEQKKDCFAVVLNDFVNVFCEEVKNDVPFLDIFQQFPISNVLEVATSSRYDVPYLFMINPGPETQLQHSVDIWKYNTTFKNFRKEQVVYIASANSISAISFQDNHFLAISSAHVQNARHPGLLDIRKYNPNHRTYESVQQFRIHAPFEVELAVLPTKELVLYILTKNPTQPLLIYEYLGISGFKEKIVAGTIEKINSLMSFTSERINQHFILAQNEQEIRVIQAILKGNKYDV